MPWTDCKNFAQGLRLVAAADRNNGGVVIDPIHFDRGGSHADEILETPRALLRYMQRCDAPAQRPIDVTTLLRIGHTCSSPWYRTNPTRRA